MTATPESRGGIDRRRFLAFFAALGLAGTSLPRRLWAAAAEGPITRKVLARAEQMAGLEFTDSERDLMLEGLGELRDSYARLRQVALDNSVPPAFRFDPSLEPRPAEGPGPGARPWLPPATKPATAEELAFLPVTKLAALLASGQVSSVELTRLYLERLERLDPLLEAVITLTEERALEQADRADRELAAGRRRGPLHGIPWGAKDLLAVAGYPTTWGATPFEDQRLAEDATVVRRLDEAGAVLVAKLTLGALAWGDVWFGGTTKNPWNLEQGSSGSSAGPGAATAAGLVGFAIGTETWGSIVSPSTRCGVTGLRPTFGAVSRHGAMALSWTMDKLGPMCRSVEDCALVFDAIRGPDGRDTTVVEASVRLAARARPHRAAGRLSRRASSRKSQRRTAPSGTASTWRRSRPSSGWASSWCRSSCPSCRSTPCRSSSRPRPRRPSTSSPAAVATTSWCARSTTPGPTSSARRG